MKKIFTALFIVVGITMAFERASTQDLNDLKIATVDKYGVVLLELFTSQGCSSCPPADVLLGETIENNKNVIGLSYHVDYWNRIGWKDPFSSKEYSDYQRSYAGALNSSSIYTPQLVVNGKQHFTGSSSSKLSKELSSQANYLKPTIEINSLKKDGNFITAKVSSANKAERLTVVLVIDEHKTPVKSGENRNKTLDNFNIVVARSVFQNTNSEQIKFEIPELVASKDKLKLIVYSQNSDLSVTSTAQGEI
jgi:hypothetical protein